MEGQSSDVGQCCFSVNAFECKRKAYGQMDGGKHEPIGSNVGVQQAQRSSGRPGQFPPNFCSVRVIPSTRGISYNFHLATSLWSAPFSEFSCRFAPAGPLEGRCSPVPLTDRMRHGISAAARASLGAVRARMVTTAAAASPPPPLVQAGHPIVYHSDMAISPIPDGHRWVRLAQLLGTPMQLVYAVM